MERDDFGIFFDEEFREFHRDLDRLLEYIETLRDELRGYSEVYFGSTDESALQRMLEDLETISAEIPTQKDRSGILMDLIKKASLGEYSVENVMSYIFRFQLRLSSWKSKTDTLKKEVQLFLGQTKKYRNRIQDLVGTLIEHVKKLFGFSWRLLQSIFRVKEFSVGGEVELGAVVVGGKGSFEIVFEPSLAPSKKTPRSSSSHGKATSGE